MKIDYITIRGFRSFRSLDKLELLPRNLLIGANGSGKSNFLAAFDLLGAVRRGRLGNHVATDGGAEAQLWFGSKNTEEMFLEVSFNDGKNGYRITLSPDSSDQFFPDDEQCWFWDKKRYPNKPWEENLAAAGLEAGISRSQQKTAAWVQRWLDGVRSYHFHDTSHSSPMKKTGDIADNRLLRPDAANLASYLYLLRKKHTGSYSMIRKAVKQVTPFFDDFILEPSRLNESKILLEWSHVASDHYFSTSSLSDGTLRFIALATLLLQPTELLPSVILIDEPELGLHPYAITMLAGLLRSASQKTQIIVSTQSSLLLDHFEPEDVLVADLVGGETTLSRLSRKPLEEWLSEYSLGQLWEKNELGGRPSRG